MVLGVISGIRSIRGKRKQTAVPNIAKGFAWFIKLDVSYATTYIFRSDGYKI